MRIVRFRIDRTDHPALHAEARGVYCYIPAETSTAIEGRIVLNRFEVALLDAVLWVRNQWFEQVTYRLGRLLCRAFGWHNVTCRGRVDHDGTETLRWPRG